MKLSHCTIELNNINRYINEQTVFWVNTSAVDKDFNFIPIKISEWYRNLKTIHLKSVQNTQGEVH